MASLNKLILIGYLGRDPETRYLPDGTAITNISVATSHSWKDKTTQEKKEETEWHRIVFRGRLAEVAGEYLKKGAQVYVDGRLRTRKWKDKEGQDRYTTEVLADTLKMLGSRPSGVDEQERSAPAPQTTGAASSKAQPATHKPTGSKFDDMEDDIPF